MIRNTVVNTVNYFYPLGNTPPVSLTQDFPPEKDPDILLLGCGDARNILFTCFADPTRQLDITCCDIEPAIVGRNVLLYTLLIDDINHVNLNSIWNLYYHWKIDAVSLQVLENQADKLLTLTSSITKWHASAYGKTLRFCDEATISRIRQFWQGCTAKTLTSTQRSFRDSCLDRNIERARDLRKELLGNAKMFNCVRSAAPNGFLAIKDFSTVAEAWWSTGTTTLSYGVARMSTNLNPMFLSSTDQSLTLHYGIDPLLGFPLATAYIPLLDSSCLFVKRRTTTSAEYLVRCAYQHFNEWTKAFRKSTQQGTLLRFCIADALSFGLTLRSGVLPQKDGTWTAHLPRHNWTFEPLILSKEEYTAQDHTAPCQFDMIDTSNLIDHLGPLNLIPICASLLNNDKYSTAYTELLVQNDNNEKERVTSLLGAEIRTIALLLGLSPCEVWTNATNTVENDSIFDSIVDETKLQPSHQSRQVRSRLRWKVIHSCIGSKSIPSISIEATKLARLLVNLYCHMFSFEDVTSLLTDLSINSLRKRSNPSYNRASFVLLLDYLQRTVTTDWKQCLQQVESEIFSQLHQFSIGTSFVQELLLHLHMLGIMTARLPAISLDADQRPGLAPFFATWDHIPAQVCVTIRVPRQRLRLFTSRAITETSTPTLRCEIQGGGGRIRSWSSIFTSVVVAFGHAKYSQDIDGSTLQVIEDGSSWWGESDMFAAVFVPTWMLLQADEPIPTVTCGLMVTPHAAQAFVRDLGLSLGIFSADITSADVVISKNLPGMSGTPRLTAKTHAVPLQRPHSMVAMLSSDATTVTTISAKISYKSEAERLTLKDESIPVTVHYKNMFRASINIGSQISSTIDFPVPVNRFQHKVRIARTSSFVEIDAPLWNPLTDKASCFLFPIVPFQDSSSKSGPPIPWTPTRISLDVLPKIDCKDKKAIHWLTMHTSLMFSAKERAFREAGMAHQLPPGSKPNILVEVKEGLFTMFMTYTGLQGELTRVFGLNKDIGGVHVLIIPSSLRLDLVNRSIILDVAIIPLTNAMMADRKATLFLQSLTNRHFREIRVLEEELACWKSILPALTERCRLWKHLPTCEYAITGEVPLAQGFEDGNSPLCSCGRGKFPEGYLQDLKVTNLGYMLKRYATRAAISPIFAVPYVEDYYRVGSLPPKMSVPTRDAADGCEQCGAATRKDVSAGVRPLLVCSRGQSAKYCSVECQKADWKRHKVSCSRS